MRVLYFSRDYTTHDRRFLVKLAESRHEVWALRLEDDGIAYEGRSLPKEIHQVDWQGGRQRHNSVAAWLHLMPDFESVLDQVKPDLVHAGPIQSCGFMAALAGFRPLLVMSWGSDILADSTRDKLWYWITCYTLKRSDLLLCDCQAVRERAQELVPYSNERIVQFPWGIDLHKFTPGEDSLSLRNLLGWEGSFVILSTRSWEQIYGIDTLLDAFWRAYLKNSRLRLMLLGDGSHAPKIRQFIADHLLNDVVWQPGMVPHEHLQNYYRAADLYVSCTHFDGTSVSLLEAMATGLPVVVTNSKGNQEWIVSEENGWLFEAGDSEALTKVLLQVEEIDSDKRARISRENRHITEERADWDKNFKKLLVAYDWIEAKYVQ